MAPIGAPASEWPAPPPSVGEYAATVWRDFGRSPGSGLVVWERDGEALRHWIHCVHAREAIWRETLEHSPTAVGSMEQMVAHPLWAVWAKLNREIEVAEQRFGMTPLYFMRLTGQLNQAQAAVESIEKRERRRPKLTIRSVG